MNLKQNPMPFTDSQMAKFEAHFHKKTKRKCPMCGGRKFEFGMDALGMLRVDAGAAAKIVEPDRGRVVLFVNCLDCGHYMLFKPEIVEIF
jgi:DNA-directed RNA polymerase subunit RPC12/RpoP